MNYRPGEKVPRSGIYGEYSSMGEKLAEMTCVKGEPFPPTVGNGAYYKIVQAAIHRPSRG